MHRAAVEWILGLRPRGRVLRIEPCIPRGWKGFGMRWRHGAASYEIAVENPDGVCRGVVALELDGEALAIDPPEVPLRDDGAVHRVRVVLGG